MQSRLPLWIVSLALLGCAASGGGPSPEDEATLANAISSYRDEPVVIRVETEEELVEQLTYLIEDTVQNEAQYREAYNAYLEAGGEPPVTYVSMSSQETCAAAAAASGAAVGAVVGELVVDACRRVAIRFAWSPWGWASAIVCTAIDITDIDRALGTAIGRALGGALAQCAAAPDGVIGEDNVPVIAQPGAATTAPEDTTVPEEETRAYPEVQGCSSAQVADLCRQPESGRKLVTSLYHGADACGDAGDPTRLYQFTECEPAMEVIFGESVSSMSFDAYCQNAATIAERGARCVRGREIDGFVCFDAPDRGHQTALDRARDLTESCRGVIRDYCEGSGIDPDSGRFSPNAQTPMYCAPATS